MISESYAQRIKDYIKDVIKNNDVMNSQKTLPADFVAMSAAAKLFTKSALMGMDGSVRHYEFEEIPNVEDIENLPFTEAVEYLKKRSVLSKVDYEKLSDKLRFRAFTASRIADGDLLKRINTELIKNVDSGDGLKSFLSMTKDELLSKVGMGANQGWYWETVYRTNVQTAYNVGRAMAFEQDKPLAYELIAIDDNRTTDICRPYATKRVVLASDDPFWKTHWPPFHFNCRTTVRAIYDESELPEHFESVQDVPSAKGFGEYPLNTDSWWQELESQSTRAKDYGIQEEIEEARKILTNRKKQSKFEIKNKANIEKFEFYKIDLNKEDKKLFKDEYNKATIEAKAFISKYGKKMRMNCYENTGGYYAPFDNKIHFNINTPRAESIDFGYKKNMITFFHEFGHWLDYNAMGDGKYIRDGLPKLKELLTKDALDYVNNFIKEKDFIKNFIRNTKQEKLLMQKISIDIWKNSSTNSNISDIFEGITNGKILDGYGHGLSYWKRPMQLEKEVVAEMFETMATGGVRKEAMVKYFPTAYNYFENYMKDLLK